MTNNNGNYEMESKEKTVQELLKNIKTLNREINLLKRNMEKNCITGGTGPDPKYLKEIKDKRMYLEKAIKAYEETGEQYPWTKAEQRAHKFERMIPSIKSVTLTFGGYIGYKTRACTVLKDKVTIETTDTFIGEWFEPNSSCELSKEQFFADLKELHIGEWKKAYVYPYICDGIGWELEFGYGKKHRPVSFSGSNAFPYNYNELLRLLGIEGSIEV